MIFFRPGSQARRLIELLAVTGEFPVSSLYLFGSQRSMRELVNRLSEIQQYRNPKTDETLTCRLLTLTGRGRMKAVRLLKSGLPILDWFGGREYYEATWREHNLPSDASHREPRFRFAEAALLLIRSGVEVRPWQMPPIQTSLGGPRMPSRGCLYSSRDLKSIWSEELRKTQYVRLTGAVLSEYHGMAVYNTRNAVMKWNGDGELKARVSLEPLIRLNSRAREANAAILFGKSEEVAVRTIEDFRKSRRYDLRFNAVYRYIFFVPLSKDGIDQLRLLMLPDREERLLSALFDPGERSYNRGSFEYDAHVGGEYVFQFFDGDIARLEHFRYGISGRNDPCVVLCFPFQAGLVKRVVGEKARIETYDAKTVLGALESRS